MVPCASGKAYAVGPRRQRVPCVSGYNGAHAKTLVCEELGWEQVAFSMFLHDNVHQCAAEEQEGVENVPVNLKLVLYSYL